MFYVRKHWIGIAILGCLLLPRSAACQPRLPEAKPPYYRVQYAASKNDGELPYGVSYTVWIPPGVQSLRGLIVHQHGCGEGACRAGQTAAFDYHWQALAAKHECALLGPSYEQPEGADCQLWCDPRNGSEKAFLRALDELSTATGHAELAKVPWALWGHSGGATWAGSMLMLHPQRCAAVWLRSGVPRIAPKEGAKLPPLDIPSASLTVPLMCNLGTQEGVTVKEGRFSGVWPNVEQFFSTMRSKGSLIGVSIDPLSSHDCGNQRYLAIPWFDDLLSSRLATTSEGLPQPFNGQAFLADLLGEAAIAEKDYRAEKLKAIWLPSERVARAWEQYSKDTQIADVTPPPSPTQVTQVENTITWHVQADLESGLAGFIVLRDGKEIARLPDPFKNAIGRPIFQRNSYSDTPSQPLAELRFVDSTNPTDGKHSYQIVAINSVGLSSPPSPSSNPAR